ncbi:OTU domain-containing protein At3g57810 isoform X1 [Vigna radiata var. radiata]|uniref:Ubiquitin thioesterase OTU n=1 Tax=Vigna radiata var. radiata TaxID=3916 RepID=A0A1S3TAC8_VIGRR|nr:OTU domain-containing protein At3g57810 isoform X1 [Vigna radiata var. radiata]
MAHKPFKFNEDILEQLRNGTAKFELLSSPVPSVAAPPNNNTSLFGIGNCSALFFARIGSSGSSSIGHSPAMRKLEHFSVQKVTGDGRCLFRALVKGMAYNKGTVLNQREERENADELRMAVKEAICENEGERNLYEEALIAIRVDEPLNRYCQRIARPDFWGGESELLVLSKLCKQPIVVYIPEHEHRGGGFGSGFIPIAEYGSEFRKGSRRKAVRLLYSGKNHYDLLV